MPPAEPPPAEQVEVVVADEQDLVPIELERWAELARSVLADEGRSGELTLTFVDPDDMAALHLEHMGLEGPTDVLSFPLDAGEADVPGIPVLLGDVIICPAVAADAAPDHAGTLDDELALLVVHGVLHVLGHDHTDTEDTAAMQARELHHLESWHWRAPAPEGFSLTHADHRGTGH